MKAGNDKYFLMVVVIFSVLAFGEIFGFQFLNIRNVDWLFRHSDTAMGQIAWQYFDMDSWHWPPGANPNYGMEFSSGILMSDSNAFFALIFKVLPIDGAYQYFGVWLLVCFVLQGVFAFKLARSVGISLVGSSFFAGFCVVSPIMIWRLDGHLNLVGHWLILAALYLYFSMRVFFDIWHWISIIFVSTLVHPYIGVMCCLIFAAYFGKLFLSKRYALSSLVFLGGGGVLSFIFALWIGGYFLLGGSGSAGGFGFYRMNVLSFIQPIPVEWSRFFKAREGFGAGDYEGNAYVGVGFLVLLIVGFPYFFRSIRGSWRGNIALIGVCIIFVMFAVSNNIGVGAENFTFSLPGALVNAFGVMRASGRFIWPVWYLILLFAFYVLSNELNRKQFLFVVVVGFCLQLYDTSNGLGSVNNRWGSPFQQDLKSSLWAEACKKYSSVRVFAPADYRYASGELWMELGAITSSCGLPTNIVRYTRSTVSEDAYLRAWADFLEKAKKGSLEGSVLYVMDEKSAALYWLNIQDPVYSLIKVDGLYVVQPIGKGDQVSIRELPFMRVVN